MIKFVRTAGDMIQAIRTGVCYISGPITGVKNYKENFAEAESVLMHAGMIAINPAYMPDGLKYDDYFPTCYAQIGVSNALCFLPDYNKSTGAAREAKRAQWNKKEYWAFTLEQYYFFEECNNLRKTGPMINKADKRARKYLADRIKTAKNGIRISGALLEEWLKRVNPPKTEKQKQNDRVKRILQSYQDCLRQIDVACDEIEMLDTKRKRITVQYREVHGGSEEEYKEKVIDNITQLEREIEEHTKELQAQRRKVKIWIGMIDNQEERSIVGLCYLNGLSFKQIAKKMNFEYGYVRKMHGRAIDKLREILEEAVKKSGKKQKKEQKGTTTCGIV